MKLNYKYCYGLKSETWPIVCVNKLANTCVGVYAGYVSQVPHPDTPKDLVNKAV